MYSVGGYDGSADTSKLYAYDAQAASWTAKAPATDAREAGAAANVGGKLVWTGGWGPGGSPDGKTEIYDAAGDSWSSAAPYPQAVAWEACGGIGGKVYCAGGNTDAATSTKTYVYDPAADSWTALPNLNTALYRGTGAVGFYAIGGNPGGAFAPPVATDQLLAGYDQGGTTDVPWLSEDPTDLTLAAGASATVTVTLNAADPSIAQPGVYTAAVTVTTDTPYSMPNVAVTMTVTPPATWGKIAGTVTTVGKTGAAVPVPGATVELDGWAQTFTLTTDAGGKYGIWMDRRNNPITAIVADNGFKPQTARLKVVAGQTVTKNWLLMKK